MPIRNVLLSLITEDNDFQRAQAEGAQTAANANGFNLEIVYSEGEAVLQVQKILRALQQKPCKYDAIISEPVGTTMETAAKLAATSNVAWGILNHDCDYISMLRRMSKATAFEVSNDHVGIGRIQAAQTKALLPDGGLVMYVQGPMTGGAAPLRMEGMMAAKPHNIELRPIKGDWTRASTRRSFANWLTLSTSRKLKVGAIICQNDAMALGVRDAIEATFSGAERQFWLGIPMTGVDGLADGGISYVQRDILAATVVVPNNAQLAIELLAKVNRGLPIPERTLCDCNSYPPVEKLREHHFTMSAPR